MIPGETSVPVTSVTRNEHTSVGLHTIAAEASALARERTRTTLAWTRWASAYRHAKNKIAGQSIPVLVGFSDNNTGICADVMSYRR